MPTTSQTWYNGDHSLIFERLDGSNQINTWNDWFLIPTSRPVMVYPPTQTKFIELEGMDGSYDDTNYLNSDAVYSDRIGSFEFIVDNGHFNWLTIYERIYDYFRGRRLRMYLTDDLTWYYEGRFSLNEFKSDQNYSRIVVNYHVNPYKMSIYSDYVQNLLWDPFNFELDYDYSVLYHATLNNQTKSYTITMTGVPTNIKCRFVSGTSVTATLNGVSKTLNTPNQTATLGVAKRVGNNTLTLSGTGVVDVGWSKVGI